MTNKKSPKNAAEILKALTEFVYTPDIDIDTAPIEKVKQELQENGIDADGVAEQIRANFFKEMGQAQLSTAKEKRMKQKEQFSKKNEGLGLNSSLRETILSYINNLMATQPKMAQTYFRKLNEAGEEDLESLLEDISMLDEMDD